MDAHKKIVIVRTAGTAGLIGNIITLNIPAVIGFILCWAENKRMIKGSGIFYAIAAVWSFSIAVFTFPLAFSYDAALDTAGLIYIILSALCAVMDGIFAFVLLSIYDKVERDKYFE